MTTTAQATQYYNIGNLSEIRNNCLAIRSLLIHKFLYYICRYNMNIIVLYELNEVDIYMYVYKNC